MSPFLTAGKLSNIDILKSIKTLDELAHLCCLRYILWSMQKYRLGQAPEEFAHPPKPKRKIRGYAPCIPHSSKYAITLTWAMPQARTSGSIWQENSFPQTLDIFPPLSVISTFAFFTTLIHPHCSEKTTHSVTLHLRLCFLPS